MESSYIKDRKTAIPGYPLEREEKIFRNKIAREKRGGTILREGKCGGDNFEAILTLILWSRKRGGEARKCVPPKSNNTVRYEAIQQTDAREKRLGEGGAFVGEQSWNRRDRFHEVKRPLPPISSSEESIDFDLTIRKRVFWGRLTNQKFGRGRGRASRAFTQLPNRSSRNKKEIVERFGD